MEVRRVEPDRTLIQLDDQEREDLGKALRRLGGHFSFTAPIVAHLGAALWADPAPRQQSRLDPAFSGPPLEGDGNKGLRVAPDEEESLPIRRVPTREDYWNTAQAEADWNESRGE